MLEATIKLAKEVMKEAMETATLIKVADVRLKDLDDVVKDHEKRISKLEARGELDLERLKVAFLEAKAQLPPPAKK